MKKITKILVPTDLSDLSKRGVRYALELARENSAEVIVYHVIDVGDEWAEGHEHIHVSRDILGDNVKALDKFLASNFADCINLVEVRKLVEIGKPFRALVEKAEREGVDLIVMATHGRTGLSHMLMGSVAEKVVSRATCPVLVVPRADRTAASAAA